MLVEQTHQLISQTTKVGRLQCNVVACCVGTSVTSLSSVTDFPVRSWIHHVDRSLYSHIDGIDIDIFGIDEHVE